jgi:hypothetical protein
MAPSALTTLLTAMAEHMVCQNACHHRFSNWGGPDAHARVMTANCPKRNFLKIAVQAIDFI